MEQAAQNVADQAVPAARAVGEQVEDGAERLKKNAGPAADDAVAGARKARPLLPAGLRRARSDAMRSMSARNGLVAPRFSEG
jgi:hypothetical protein